MKSKIDSDLILLYIFSTKAFGSYLNDLDYELMFCLLTAWKWILQSLTDANKAVHRWHAWKDRSGWCSRRPCWISCDLVRNGAPQISQTYVTITFLLTRWVLSHQGILTSSYLSALLIYCSVSQQTGRGHSFWEAKSCLICRKIVF